MFMTLGNFEVDPRASLAVLDFERGSVVSLSGSARLHSSTSRGTGSSRFANGSSSTCRPCCAGSCSTSDKVASMPAPLMTKPEMLGRLLDLFRDNGFDGASLSDISDATGLGKSSLYHHFPNGKEEIALQVLAFLEEQLELALFEPMRAAGTPRKKLDRMLDTIDAFYEGGKKPACSSGCAPASTPGVSASARPRVQHLDRCRRGARRRVRAAAGGGAEPRRRRGGPRRGRPCGVRRYGDTASSRAPFASSAKASWHRSRGSTFPTPVRW
jgi:AcrR family transcriptional regulator